MIQEIKKITKETKFGLNPTPKDKKDFDYGKVFGGYFVDVPMEDFDVGIEPMIEDQKATDYCPAMASSSVAEDHEGMDLDPLFSFAAIKSIDGKPNEWGSDLRSAAKAACKIGFLEKKDAIFTIDDDRTKIIYLNNYPDYLKEKAKEHCQQSYFWVRGKDTFQAIRRVLWANKATKSSIFTGVNWRAGWEESEEGIIPTEESDQWQGHALKLRGQKIINGVPYLKAQLSNGETIGDKGIFYFPQEVINRDFTFGAIFFSDMPIAEAKQKAWSLGRRILESIKKFFSEL